MQVSAHPSRRKLGLGLGRAGLGMGWGRAGLALCNMYENVNSVPKVVQVLHMKMLEGGWVKGHSYHSFMEGRGLGTKIWKNMLI